MGRNIIVGLLFLILLALILSAVGNSLGWFDRPGAPAPAPATPATPAQPTEPVGDGGAEQLPDEPLPATPATPVDSDQTPPPPATPVDFPHNPAGALKPGSGSGYLDRTLWSP
ncbi:MAG TPA: hypothetical protein VEA44_04075, partial [Caulobacter sp.]|nr:hypothetical protein [Caulobacter sp.]